MTAAMLTRHDLKVCAAEHLGERQQARVDWLERAIDQWSDDPCVAGAWLWGSEGTGTADALSDYDLFVALSVSAAHEQLELVDSWFPRYGQVRWSRESQYNAPTGGRYFTVGYPAPLVPLGIDWYWQPEAFVQVGSDTRILVEKHPLPRVATPTFQLFPNVRTKTPFVHPDDPRERLEGRLRLFWSMYGALGKWAARGQDARVARELPRLSAVVDLAADHASTKRPAIGDAERPLAALRRLADEMTDLHPSLANAGVRVPDTETSWTSLLLAEALRADGWDPTEPAPPRASS